MNDDNKRLSVENLIDDENRVTVLEGDTPEEHSGTLTYNELTELDDRITVLEGETPEEKELRINDLLYFDDRITALEEKQDDVTLTYNVNGGTGTVDPVTVDSGTEVTLNDGSGITAPDSKAFAGWGETDSALPADKLPDKITLTANKTVYAIYDDAQQTDSEN